MHVAETVNLKNEVILQSFKFVYNT